MELNQKVKITVAEPWDFSSEEGDNLFIAIVVDKIQINNNFLCLLKVAKPFQNKKYFVEYGIASPRHLEESSKALNLYYLGKENISRFTEIKDTKVKQRVPFGGASLLNDNRIDKGIGTSQFLCQSRIFQLFIENGQQKGHIKLLRQWLLYAQKLLPIYVSIGLPI